MLIVSIPFCVAEGEYEMELKPFDFDVEVEALKVLNAEFSAYSFAKTLNIKEPLFSPKLTPTQITLKIENELQRILKKNFPNSRYEEIKEEAEKQYTMYKVGSKVSIKRQYGGQQLQVSGLLEVVSNDLIKISGTTISAVDIDREDLARLYWTHHEAEIEKYVRSRTHAFEEKRKEFIKKERATIAKTLWKQAGYKRLKKSKRWVSVMDVFLHQYQKARDKKLAHLREKVRKEIYLTNDFVFDEARGWIPKAVLVAEMEAEKERNAPLIDRMKKFFMKQTKVEAKQPINDESGADESIKPPIPEDLPQEDTEFEEDLWGDDLFSDDDTDESKPESSGKQKPLSEKETKESKSFNDVSDLFDEDDD